MFLFYLKFVMKTFIYRLIYNIYGDIMVNRRYCIKGLDWHKGEVETIDEYGRSKFRTVRDNEFSYRDGPVHYCFTEKEDSLNNNKEPCFDEGRMWCVPNDCSVFECNRLWWSKRKKRIIKDLNRYLRNKDEILKICFEMTYIKSDEDFVANLWRLSQLHELLPCGRVCRDYEYEKIKEEEEI